MLKERIFFLWNLFQFCTAKKGFEKKTKPLEFRTKLNSGCCKTRYHPQPLPNCELFLPVNKALWADSTDNHAHPNYCNVRVFSRQTLLFSIHDHPNIHTIAAAPGFWVWGGSNSFLLESGGLSGIINRNFEKFWGGSAPCSPPLAPPLPHQSIARLELYMFPKG